MKSIIQKWIMIIMISALLIAVSFLGAFGLDDSFEKNYAFVEDFVFEITPDETEKSISVYILSFENGKKTYAFKERTEASKAYNNAKNAGSLSPSLFSITFNLTSDHCFSILVKSLNWYDGELLKTVVATVYAESTSVLNPVMYGRKDFFAFNLGGIRQYSNVSTNSGVSCPGVGNNFRLGIKNVGIETVSSGGIQFPDQSVIWTHTH